MNAPGPLPFPADGHAPAGHRLGHFELRGVAARNAHGIVYRAWDHELGIAVAIKEYLPQQLARRDVRGDLQPQGSAAIGAFERGREAFVNEVRLLARCDHPSLLRVRQLLHLHGTVYRVMPWCQGWPLAELRREMAAPPDEPALRRLLLDVLGALEAWHRVGGPHGSVNPAKILLLDDDRALLLGPGLARRAASDGLDAPATPFDRPFQAPEQRHPSRQTPCGPWTDFFALAQVIRYCITGMLPAPDARPAEPLATTVDALYFDAPNVRYDADFLRVVDAATSPTMADRPQTATEFRDWLEHGPRRTLAVPAAPAATADDAAAAEKAQADAGAAVDIPVDEAVPVAAAADEADASRQTAASTAAAPPQEAVDEATVDLIRRVIEAIPERQEPPRPTQHAPDRLEQTEFTEHFLRFEDGAQAPEPALQPAPRRATGLRWLLGVAVLGGAAWAAWAAWATGQWGWPGWRPGTEAAETSARSAAAAQPLAPPAAATATSAASATLPTTADAPASAPGAAASGAASTEEPAEPEATPPGPVAQATAPSTSAVATVVVADTPPAPAAPEPAAPEPAATPARRNSTGAPATAPASASVGTPRQACGSRTQFALYRCMQQQCTSAAWARHEQCTRFKATDRVD